LPKATSATSNPMAAVPELPALQHRYVVGLAET